MVSSRAVNAQLEADREDAWHLPLSLEEGSWSPTGRSPGSGSLPLGSFPRLLASVDLAHDSPVTVTGSRRIHTGFPFQLSSSHLSALFTCRGAWPASPPQKVTAL